MGVPEPRSDDFEALWPQLRRAAARGTVPHDDVEDVTQEALLKLIREHPAQEAPSLQIRGFVALRHARAEYHRRRNRAKERPYDALENHLEIGRIDAGLRLVELEDVLLRVVGADSLDFARHQQAGMTEAEIAALPGWTPQRAGAARRRLRRAADRLETELLDD